MFRLLIPFLLLAAIVRHLPAAAPCDDDLLVPVPVGKGTRGRYLRITGTQRTTGCGYSLYEIEAYGTP